MSRSTLITAAVATIVGILAGRWLFPSAPAPAAPPPTTVHADHAAAATVWTCSMHPQIQQPDPGKCPICGMDLIPLADDSTGESGPRTLSMSEASRALAEIETTAVERAFPSTQVRLVGKLDYDETRVRSLTARFPARVDQLFVNYTGVPVRPGEHLARVYSPELLTAQRELLTAHRSDPNGSITRVAREKLRLWDLQSDQIDSILEHGEASDQFELRAPIGGVVVTKNVKEGDYLKTGDPLFRIVDLSRLWLHLEAYESDLPWLRYGQDIEFTVEAFPGETFHGRIAFIAPEVDRRTRTIAIRVNVPNPERRLKPGMFARGQAEVRIADRGQVFAPELAGKWIGPMHPEIIRDEPGDCPECGMPLVPAEQLGYVEQDRDNEPLVVPSSAVLRTGKRAVVYVAVPDADRPTYEGREVVLGPRAGDRFIVERGLAAGDRVVTHGAFKIDSALQIQAKPSMMNPAGDPDDGMAMPMPTAAGTDLELSPERAHEILPAYFDLQAALADDDLAAARTALRAMMELTGHHGALPDLIHQLLGADNLDAVRRPHFETLTNAIAAALRRDPEVLDAPVYVMHCPMAYEDRGADWLQPTADLRNPYFGAMMLTCGELTEKIPGRGTEGAGRGEPQP